MASQDSNKAHPAPGPSDPSRPADEAPPDQERRRSPRSLPPKDKRTDDTPQRGGERPIADVDRKVRGGDA